MKQLLFFMTIVFLSGCGTLNFPVLNAPKPPDQVYKYHQTISTEPRVVQTNDKGQSVVFTAQTQAVDVNYDKTEKPLTWWQRFCNWLSSFGILGILVLIIAIIVAPTATIGWLITEKNKIKAALTQTVQGIDKSGVVAKDPTVAQALSSTQDNATKAMVDDIQQPGK